MVLDSLVSRPWKRAPVGKGMLAELNGTLLLKPHTYMNRSGSAVAAVTQYYKVDPGDVLVISDDADLPFGTIRYRQKGSAGGQRGLEDILKALNTENIARIRIGIGRGEGDLSDYVLKPFNSDEKKALPSVLDEAVVLMREWLDE